jgi:murein DD-endopeptidase MepM/ murein hydrolase activator NlpD
MRRLAPIALIVALAVLAGTAHAGTFTIVQTPAPFALPSADTPNAPGAVAFPAALSTPPAAPIQLSYTQLLGLWQRAGAAYGIPWQVLAAINKVESNFGRNMGPSSAGAIGWMQFMPSTWIRWGTDANGDGVADPWNPDDAVFSAARYLAAAGGTADVSRAVFSYNHADWYVHEVLSLAALYGQGSGVAFSLDQLQVDLGLAESAVSQASTRVAAARSRVAAAARVENGWRRLASRATLLSDRLAYERDAGLAEERKARALASAGRAGTQLATAQAQLERARSQSAPISFAAGASSVLGAPSYQGGWAFPVGGGPGIVSVAHTHHDYPAADIAAPAGSPVYSIAQAVVLRSWTQPDPRCGIGLTLRTFDGQTWTYCHLSYLEPTIVPGASLTAGASVGLVGSTGDASGPHLHLQLDPQTQYPQEEAWFQSFAGVAYSWQDTPTPESDAPQTLRFAAAAQPAADFTPAANGPVFSIAPTATAAPTATPIPVAGVVLFSHKP